MDGARVPVIDERLLAEARRMTGFQETDEIVREALTALIQREAARRLAAAAVAASPICRTSRAGEVTCRVGMNDRRNP